jgi:formiminotetrahydrofolate cyclodeaminase
MSLWSSTLESYLSQVSADTPVPSCGATASVCANLGLGLLLMALRNAARKYPAAERQELIGAAEGLAPILMAHADNDVRTFQAYIDELSSGSGEHTEQGRLDITLGSLAAARSCYQGLILAEQALPWVLPHMRSDVISAAMIMHASLEALLLNVDSNCSHAGNLDTSADLVQTRVHLQREADAVLRGLRRDHQAQMHGEPVSGKKK